MTTPITPASKQLDLPQEAYRLQRAGRSTEAAAKFHDAYETSHDDSWLFEEAKEWRQAKRWGEAMTTYNLLLGEGEKMLAHGMPLSVFVMVRGAKLSADLHDFVKEYPQEAAFEIAKRFDEMLALDKLKGSH